MWHWGWSWWMVIGMAAFWVLVAVVIWLLVRPATTSRRPAEEILAERFARGELSAEEYETGRRALAGR